MAEKMTGYPSIDKPWLKYYSEEAVSTPLPACTVYEYMRDSNKEHPSNIALNYFGSKIAYGELLTRIDEATTAFQQAGVKKGDIVALCTVTTPEMIYAFYALNRLGAVCSMIDPRTNESRICECLNSARVTIVLAIDMAWPKLKKILGKTSVKKIITVSIADSMPIITGLGYKLTKGRTVPHIPQCSSCIAYKDFTKTGTVKSIENIPAYAPNTPAVIIYTGGTTGVPKGALLSNDNLNAMAFFHIHSNTRMERTHKLLGIMPPFIAYGMVCGITDPLALGLEIIIIPKFDPKEFGKLMIKYRPNHALGVPSFWESFAKSPNMEKKDLSFIKNAITGGDKISSATEDFINNFFKTHNCKYRLAKGYGMTELSSAATYSVWDTCNLPGSVGIPLVRNIFKIVRPGTEEELKYNEMGEVCIYSPTIMLGYFENEEETAKTLKKHRDGKTWVHTQDIGYINEDGVVFIVDRMKRMIIRPDGHNVWPSQIESVITQHPSVETCAVVGVPNPEGKNGQIPTAFIVLKQDISGSDDLIRNIDELSKKRLPERDVALAYYFCDSLPLTPVGKVDFRALEQKAAQMKAV